MPGYGGTDAPESPVFYTHKRVADDISTLASQLGLSSFILGGHDWGGAVVYRFAMYYPKLVSAFFSVCTPYWAPKTEYVSMTKLPNFKYQLQLQGSEVEDSIVGEQKIRQFLNGLYGGHGPNGERLFTADHGCHFELLSNLTPTPLLTPAELDFYAKRYAIHGMHGPLNWYRTSELNFEDEKEMAAEIAKNGYTFEMPALFIAGSRDEALPPRLSEGMERYFRDLSRGEVNAGHWALWEKPAEVNKFVEDWLKGLSRANL
jgi:soluble epoxide hydrolase/lipid-phosphate phosphatase